MKMYRIWYTEEQLENEQRIHAEELGRVRQIIFNCKDKEERRPYRRMEQSLVNVKRKIDDTLMKITTGEI